MYNRFKSTKRQCQRFKVKNQSENTSSWKKLHKNQNDPISLVIRELLNIVQQCTKIIKHFHMKIDDKISFEFSLFRKAQARINIQQLNAFG